MRHLRIFWQQLGPGVRAKLLAQLELGSLVARPSSTCMATRWHLGLVTANLGRQWNIGWLSPISLWLIRRTIVTAASTPSIELTLHRVCGSGGAFRLLMALKASDYIAWLPVMRVVEIEAVLALVTVDLTRLAVHVAVVGQSSVVDVVDVIRVVMVAGGVVGVVGVVVRLTLARSVAEVNTVARCCVYTVGFPCGRRPDVRELAFVASRVEGFVYCLCLWCLF